MDIKKDPLIPESGDKPKDTAVSKEKVITAPRKDSAATVSAMTTVNEKIAATETADAEIAPAETADAKPTEKQQANKPVAPATPKSKESIQPRPASNSQAEPRENSKLTVNLEKLEEKITRNMEQFKEINRKISDADDEIEEIKAKKRKETLGEKAKKTALFLPKVCVEANVCRFPKALCRSCGKIVDVWKSASKTGMKAIGVLAGKCSDSLSTGMRLPIIRMKMNNNFKKLGDCAYKMYLEGDKDILKNVEIKKIIDEVKGYENQIEALETHLSDLNEQPIGQKQNA